MTAGRYRENRVEEQRRFSARRQRSDESAIRRLRSWSLGLALAAAVLEMGATWLGQEAPAPWSAVMTTVAAFGPLERRQFLAASYGAMVGQLGLLEALHEEGALGLEALVASREDLPIAEGRAWADRVAQMPFRPPAAPARPDR